MGLISWLLQCLGWRTVRPSLPTSNLAVGPSHDQGSAVRTYDANGQVTSQAGGSRQAIDCQTSRQALRLRKPARLVATRRNAQKIAARSESFPYVETKGSPPYRYARYGSQTGHYLDLSRDGDEARLVESGLPVFHTPEQLADWIGLPLNKVAWLVHRFSGGRPGSIKEAHYHFHWLKKRLGGWRLIEAPKSTLKQVQSKILRELLDKVPVHSSAHGFTSGRSILTNARPHVGQGLILKLDLVNFYTTVSFARVVAIYRGLGYSREIAIWLGLLTTSAIPGNLSFQEQGPYVLTTYLRRHLPQGAPTSPALANLSAFWLDVRISGLARSFGAKYTRYADDLTISGPTEFGSSLRTIIPLINQIIRQERFFVNNAKRRVLRAHQRQTVTGVIVNEKPNISRVDFDHLKAILTNCLRHGPSTQNRDCVDSFFNHLQGSIAHVAMLNPARGEKLNQLFHRIDWAK